MFGGKKKGYKDAVAENGSLRNKFMFSLLRAPDFDFHAVHDEFYALEVHIQPKNDGLCLVGTRRKPNVPDRDSSCKDPAAASTSSKTVALSTHSSSRRYKFRSNPASTNAAFSHHNQPASHPPPSANETTFLLPRSSNIPPRKRDTSASTILSG